MAWQLLETVPHAAGVHRSGWPHIHAELAKRSTRGAKWLLVDFADQQLRKRSNPIGYPWVGIFHYPAEIDSPLREDSQNLISHLFTLRQMTSSLRDLKAAICLTSTLARKLDEILPKHIPIGTMLHPTETNVPQWYEARFQMQLVQVGFFLRDTRAIFKVEPRTGWERARFNPHMKWMTGRDAKLLRVGDEIPEACPETVTEIARLPDRQYDNVLASSVMLTWLHGAEANNVVVECLARCTPLVINYKPSVAEYLGEAYPLFIRSKKNLPKLLDWLTPEKLKETHEYLKVHRALSPWLEIAYFADKVDCAIRELKHSHATGDTAKYQRTQ